MTYLFKKLDHLAYNAEKLLLTDGTANKAFGVGKISLGYYDTATNTWKDDKGVALTFVPYYYFTAPIVPA